MINSLYIISRAFQKIEILEFFIGDQVLTAFRLYKTNKKKIRDIDPSYGPVRAFYWKLKLSIITRLLRIVFKIFTYNLRLKTNFLEPEFKFWS